METISRRLCRLWKFCRDQVAATHKLPHPIVSPLGWSSYLAKYRLKTEVRTIHRPLPVSPWPQTTERPPAASVDGPPPSEPVQAVRYSATASSTPKTLRPYGNFILGLTDEFPSCDDHPPALHINGSLRSTFSQNEINALIYSSSTCHSDHSFYFSPVFTGVHREFHLIICNLWKRRFTSWIHYYYYYYYLKVKSVLGGRATT